MNPSLPKQTKTSLGLEPTNRNQERIDALENERKELEEGTLLRERLRNVFKNAVSQSKLAVGKTIGVIVSALTKGLLSKELEVVLRLLELNRCNSILPLRFNSGLHL